MSLNTASLKVIASAKLDPPYTSDITGRVSLTQTLEPSQALATNALQLKVYTSASSQTASVDLTDGTVTLSATGTRQVETATVTAASGCTSNGNLTLTLTSANVTGSPLTIEVPITTSAHTTAALIAQACVNKINATAAVAAEFTATRSGANIVLTSIYARANDATLNLAITGELGVTTANSSANTTSGVVGVIVERIGSDGEDVYGSSLSAGIDDLTGLVVSNSADSAAAVQVDDDAGSGHVVALDIGGFVAHGSSTGNALFGSNSGVAVIRASGKAIVDFLAIGL